MHRALITGISGFAGPYLADYLRSTGIECAGISQGTPIHTHPVSLNGVALYLVDIRDRSAVQEVLKQVKPDRVFHLAAMTHVATSLATPDLTFDVNVVGTFNLLEGLRQLSYPVRTVLVSTGNLYGNINSGAEGFKENDPVHATSPYATSKLMSEELAQSYAEDFGLEIVIARPFNHTGPGQPPAFACPEFARAVAAGLVQHTPVHLRTGRLEPLRDISDVRDVVRAYALLAERGRSAEVYNICSGSMVSMSDIVTILAKLARIPVTTELDPAKIRGREIMRSGGNNAKIREDAGWVPEIPLVDTLQGLLDYWVSQVARGTA